MDSLRPHQSLSIEIQITGEIAFTVIGILLLFLSILRCGERFYKVLKLRSTGDNNYTFKCKDLDTRQNKTLQFNLSGILEAPEHAFKAIKSQKDIFFLDLDNNGDWKVINEDLLGQV